MPVPAQHGGRCQWRLPPCSSRRWGEDEEAEGQWSDAAPIALHGHRPVPRDGGGGKEEAAEGRGGEGEERRVAGQLPE